jgi:hypothetical protein
MVDYNPNIPQGIDNLSTSQGQMLNNFTQLNTIFDFDHFTWNDPTAGGTDRGFHRRVTFPVNVAAAPAGATGILHTVLGGATSVSFNNKPVPFFANSVGDFPMMADVLQKAGPLPDYSFKIGKIIVNAGSTTLTGASPATALITYNEPFLSTILYIGFQNKNSGNLTIYPVATATPLLSVNAKINAVGSVDAYYIAIGY